MTAAAITDVLGGRKVFKGASVAGKNLSELTREGLPASALTQLAEKLGVDRKRIAAILSISERTLSRRLAAGQRLTAEESDRTMRLARVVSQAVSTLGTLEKASHWLQAPNRALEGEMPLELMDTDAGVREVETVLGRIEYGLYS